MNFDMLNVGNGTFVRADEVNVITRFDYVKIKKEVARLKDGDNSEKLIDASKRKMVRSVVVLMNGTHILSMLSAETLAKRMSEFNGGYDE